MKRPLFSIVMATYESKKSIKKAIDSVLVQTFKDWELIIVDDGSTDKTDKVCNRYLSDDRIRYVHQEHAGASFAKNKGIEIASGKYITFLDSDDLYLPKHLESRKEVIERNPHIEFFHGGVDVIGNKFIPDKDNPTKQIPISRCVIGGSFVIKRTLFERIGYFDEVSYAEDALFYERALRNLVDIYPVEYESYIYDRRGRKSRKNKMNYEKIEKIFLSIEYHLKAFIIGFALLGIACTTAYSAIILIGLILSFTSIIISILASISMGVAYLIGKNILKELEIKK